MLVAYVMGNRQLTEAVNWQRSARACDERSGGRLRIAIRPAPVPLRVCPRRSRPRPQSIWRVPDDGVCVRYVALLCHSD